MNDLALFTDDGHGRYEVAEMARPTDLDTAHRAAVIALSSVESNRRLVLQLMFEHGPLTMFCPYVLMGCDQRYKQTAIGPRFKKLRDRDGFIVRVADRQPLDGAETTNVVSAFDLTDAGREHLRTVWS